jgi:hypothetical protein
MNGRHVVKFSGEFNSDDEPDTKLSLGVDGKSPVILTVLRPNNWCSN